ncbi:oligosaccharide flippase family protein [Ignavibacteria bacterium 4148-Me]|uniref:oligosaccharide flippase family protein n=1 Tax=Rosettibacter primus TaxID=3111523 RepID=UPI00336BF649
MKFLRNSFYNTISWVINIVLGIITVPLFLDKLGNELYGVYILIIGLVGYYSLVDMGLGQAIIKYVAEYNAKDEIESIFYSIASSFIFNIITGAFSSIIIFILSEHIVNLLNISLIYRTESLLSIKIISIGFLFSLLSSNFASIFQGLQNYKITSMVNTLINILIYIIAILGLYSGKGLLFVITIYTALNIVSFFIYFTIFTYYYPKWLINFKIKWKYIKNLFSFSVYFFLSKILNIVNGYVIQFIISTLLSPVAVTYYAVPRKFTNSASAFLGNLVSALVPKVSELNSKKDIVNLIDKYWITNKTISLISFPIFFALIVFSKDILKLWVGEELANKTYIILIVLSLQTYIGVLTIVPNNYLLGLGRTKVQSIFSIITLLFTLSIVPLFTIWKGVIGTVFGLLVCTFPGIILVFYFNKKILNINNKKYLVEIFKGNYVGIALIFFIYFIKKYSFNKDEEILIIKIIISTIFLISFYLLNRKDINFIQKYILNFK